MTEDDLLLSFADTITHTMDRLRLPVWFTCTHCGAMWEDALEFTANPKPCPRCSKLPLWDTCEARFEWADEDWAQ